MAIKFDKIKAGDVLLNVRRYKMGNTTMTAWGCWQVQIIEMDAENSSALVSWNGNRPERWFKRQLERLYRTPPKAYRDQVERRQKGGLI